MKTKLLCLLLLVSTISFSQPVITNSMPLTEALICHENLQRGINITNIPLQSFDFSIKLTFVDINGTALMNPAPSCATGASTNPIKIQNIFSNTATFTNQTVIVDGYNWNTSITGNSISELTYTILIDCNYIPVGSGSVFLKQEFYIDNILINTPSPFLALLKFPKIVALPMQNPIPGNFGQTNIPMTFSYQNVGTSNANMFFNFEDLSTCNSTGYSATIEYAVEDIGGNTSTFVPYIGGTPFINSVPLAPNEILHIRQTINIDGCMSNCTSNFAEFKWFCNNMPNDFCDGCQNTFVTNYTFVFEAPSFEVLRTSPELLANYNSNCSEDEELWEFTVKNTSALTTIKTLVIEFSQNLVNSFEIVENGDVNQPVESCAGCTALPPITTPHGSQTACSSSIVDPVNSIVYTINDLDPQGSVLLSFKSTKCCDDNPTFMDIDKMYNHWIIVSEGFSICNTSTPLYSPSSNLPDQAINPNGSGLGISSHSGSPLQDIDLTCSVVASANSVVIDAGQIEDPICGDRFSDDHPAISVRLQGLLGDDFDSQVLGYNSTVPNDLNFILKVKVRLDDAGLVVHNPTLANIISFSPGQTQIWNQIPGTFETNNSNSCCIEDGEYIFYFDVNSLNVGAGTKLDLLHHFLETGSFNFEFQGCCTDNFVIPASTQYFIEFSILPNNLECYNFVPVSPPTCVGCCWLPLSSASYHVYVHCPGCMFPGTIVDSYNIQRTTFGLQDYNNDNLADNLLPADPSAVQGINKNAAVHGDKIKDFLVGHFEPGVFTNSCSGGYTYSGMMTNAPHSITFNALQLERRLTVFNPVPGAPPIPNMHLEVESIDFYIDEIGTGTCIGCTDFDGADLFKQTVLHLSVPSGAINQFFDINSTDDVHLFTFIKAVIDINSPTFYNGNSISWEYVEEQQYRISIEYKVCGNFQANAYGIGNDFDDERLTDINNFLFLSGDGISFGDLNSTDQAPNSLSAIDDGFCFDILNCPDVFISEYTEGSSSNKCIEIFNGTEDPIDLASVGYQLQIYYDGSLTPTNINLTGIVNPGDVHVICNSNAASGFLALADENSGNLNFDGNDAIVLYNGAVNIDIIGRIGENPGVAWINGSHQTVDQTLRRNLNINTGVSINPGAGFPTLANEWSAYPIDDLANLGSHSTTCTLVDQFNFANQYKFYCESFGGAITFISTSCLNYTYYQNVPANTNCQKQALMTADVTFGRNLNQNYFPMEFKTPNLIPQILHFEFDNTDFSLPPGLNNLNLVTLIRKPGSNISNITTSLTTNNFTTGPDFIEVDLNSISSLACAQSLSGSPGTLYLSDEFIGFRLTIPLDPLDCEIFVSPPDYPVTDAQITFEENNFDCNSTYTPVCTMVDTRNNVHWIRRWSISDPNLQIAFDDNGIVEAGGDEVCWNFSITNPSIVGNANGIANNLYLEFEDLQNIPSNFADWELDLSITTSQNLPPININDIQPIGGIFEITNTFPCNQFAIISGELCATDYECIGNYSIDLNWGWNCNGYPVNTSQQVCEEFESTIQVIDLPVEIKGVPAQNNQTTFSMCDDIPLTICFNSLEKGPVIPQLLELVGIPSNLSMATSPVLRECSGSTPVTLQAGGAPDSWIVDITQIGMQAPMELSDCFCVDFTFHAGCGYEGVLPTFVLNSQSYCEDVGTDEETYVNIAPLIMSGTSCTDCFVIKKTANPEVVIEDVETVNWIIEITSYNVPGSPNTVTVTDTYPPGFIWSSGDLDQFGNTPTPTINITTSPTILNVYGTMSDPGNPICNRAFLTVNGLTTFAEACVQVDGNICNVPGVYTINNGVKASNIVGVPIGQTIVINGLFEIDVLNFGWSSKIIKMQPGAEIRVLPGNNFGLRGCTLEACSKMWNGIYLHYGAGLAMADCYVLDAHHAINVSDNNRVTVLRTEFENNFIGINVPSNIPLFNSSVYLLGGNSFNGTGSLAPKFVNQNQLLPANIYSFGNLPYAGIVAKKTYMDFVDPNTLAPHYFTNMSNGIVGIRSGFNIENCQFSTIQPETIYNWGTATSFGSNFNGSAIYGMGKKSAYTLRQKGYGSYLGAQPSFDNCNYGIFTEFMDLRSENNIMNNVNTGYRSQLTKSRILIKLNRIDANNSGIELFHNDGIQSNIVANNIITFGDSDPTQNYFGINVQENLNPNLDSRIHDNEIFFRTGALSARVGIMLRSAFSYQVTQNVISQANNLLSWDGIHLDGSEKVIASCNHITANGPIADPGDQSAIKNIMGDGPRFECNEMDNTINGIFVIGPIQTQMPFDLMGNQFNHHDVGLRYGVATITNTIDHRGNIWFENLAVPTNQARHDAGAWSPTNPNGIITNNYFFKVNITLPNLAPIFPGLNPTYLPFTDPIDWFKPDNSIVNSSCHIPSLNYYCATHYPQEDLRLEGLDLRIAEGSITNDPFTDETVWTLKKGLFTKLDNNPDLISTTLMQDFYNDTEGSFIADLKEIDDQMNDLYKLKAEYVESSDEFLTELELNQQSIKSNLIELENAFINDFPVENIISDLEILQNSLVISSSEINTEIDNQSMEKITGTESLEIINSQLSPFVTVESNEKHVKEIYMATIGKEIYDFTPNQLDILKFISNQCPLSGGNSVFKARSLYSLAGGQSYYDDRLLCNLEGISLRNITAGQNSNIKIYPNPANEKVVVEYKIEKHSTGDFRIFNSSGQLVYERKLFGTFNSLEINTSNLKQGLYHYSFMVKETLVENGKIAIIH